MKKKNFIFIVLPVIIFIAVLIMTIANRNQNIIEVNSNISNKKIEFY